MLTSLRRDQSVERVNTVGDDLSRRKTSQGQGKEIIVVRSLGEL